MSSQYGPKKAKINPPSGGFFVFSVHAAESLKKSLVWLWDYANRSQALFRELYPALKQIQSNYSGRCHDCGYEFSRIIEIARDVLINHSRDVDINEPDGPTNLSAWMRLKNKELPPSVHNY